MRTRLLHTVGLGLLALTFPLAHAEWLGPGEYPIRGKYVGTLPCTDCAGIWTEINLADGGNDTGEGYGAFVITERFSGGAHGGDTTTTHGTWLTTKRSTGMSQTGTLELRGEKRDGETPMIWHFYCDHGRSLRLLDARGDEFARSKKSTLQRVIPPPRPEFGPLTEMDNGAVLSARVGDVFEVALPAASLSDSRSAWTMKQPVSNCVVLISVAGTGADNAFSTVFRLRAAAQGSIRVEFPNARNSMRIVAFTFDVRR